jgi:hypothetical protein
MQGYERTRRASLVNIFAFRSPKLDAMSRYDRPSHRVYMTFMLSHGSWFCQFLEADAKTPLPRKLNFADPEKIRELARRGEAWGDLESKHALEHGIDTGRGGVWLRLTPEQYARLRHSPQQQ